MTQYFYAQKKQFVFGKKMRKSFLFISELKWQEKTCFGEGIFEALNSNVT